MGTRAHIGMVNKDGSVRYIYTHWDGYPDHHLPILTGHYTDEAKINQLLDLGDLSVLAEEIGESHDFDSDDEKYDRWCRAYGRDWVDRVEPGAPTRVNRHNRIRRSLLAFAEALQADGVSPAAESVPVPDPRPTMAAIVSAKGAIMDAQYALAQGDQSAVYGFLDAALSALATPAPLFDTGAADEGVRADLDAVMIAYLRKRVEDLSAELAEQRDATLRMGRAEQAASERAVAAARELDARRAGLLH